MRMLENTQQVWSWVFMFDIMTFMWTLHALKVIGKLWSSSSSYPFVVVLPSKLPVYGSVYRLPTLRKLFGTGRKRLINVTSNGNNNTSCYYRSRGFDSRTLHRGWILVLFVIVYIYKCIITCRITFVDKSLVLVLLSWSGHRQLACGGNTGG